ncbi:LysM peptidoglycan-binding domain-containing protein [Actinoallomurus iriomotensis]|uniref:LysM domain-containing protein n=1 Tax=Actinoallomurus iriomotensis TaxID=478107 RepID=A0A9W6RMK3_9ACTN|nr:LysM peptidoglycan-binding domain-containing protein [Actinoallomurus iriomotensis]GLY77850.1 hypothetical protein Airi01_061170 [Actinoallomurus iriomotensis]
MSERIDGRVSLVTPEGGLMGERRAHPGTPLRLTRRGRVVVVCAVALALLAGYWTGARHGARATSGGERGPAVARESVIVGPRDTLWGIAVRARPEVDPRVTVQRMIDLNALSTAVVNPGQKIYIPAR